MAFVPFAPVAQLDRAPDFESVGRPFESGRAYHQKLKQVMVHPAVTCFLCVFVRILSGQRLWLIPRAWRTDACWPVSSERGMGVGPQAGAAMVLVRTIKYMENDNKGTL